jgi:cell surface hyaluronidase
MYSGAATTRAIEKRHSSVRRVALGIAIALVASTLGVAFGPVRPAHAARHLVAREGASLRDWSRPRTWGGTVPRDGDKITIPFGSKVRLDKDTPRLVGLQIDGELRFARKRLELTSRWIMIHGLLRIGTSAEPHLQKAVITLTGNDRTQNIMGMGTKVLGLMTGRLEMHGRPVPGWTQLGETAAAGASDITLKETMDWRPGDKLVIASTDYSYEHAEVRTVTEVAGPTLTLDEPLDYEHWGELQTYGGKTVDERAEVGLLERNIVVRGDDRSAEAKFGAHLMVMDGIARIEGVEFTNVGQLGVLGRYPVHFHINGAAPESYVENSSIHRSFQRCVTIHGTHELEVRGNVCYDHIGHGYFFEDGIEHDNVLEGNLGLGTRATDEGLLPTDARPATFWITNPDNVIRNNVAAGSDRMGFWYALPEHPTGPSHNENVWPQRTPLKVFSGNVSHSNGDQGLHIDHGPRPDGRIEATWYKPKTDPSDEDSAPVVARFENLTAYKNRNNGIWSRGSDHVFAGAVLADNQAGATFASWNSFLEDSLVVGETANAGTAERWEDRGYLGRPLPKPWDPSEPIVGFEFYDGLVGARGTTFSGFHSNPVRQAGALSSLLANAFSIDPKNYTEDVSFVDTNEVYLADPAPGLDGDNSQVFIDMDGSVTGTQGAAVVIDNPFLLEPDCSFVSEWNAHICPTPDYTSFGIGALDGNPSDIKPLLVKRPDGVTQSLRGCCNDSNEAWTTLHADAPYEVEFNGGTPVKSRFILRNGRNHWVTVSFPVSSGYKVTRWGSPLQSATSLTNLAQKTSSAYYYDSANSRLHLRVVGSSSWEEIRVESP